MTGLPPVVGFPVGVVAGTLATLAMDAVTPRLPEGFTPPRVAAGVLTDTHPDDAPERLAAAVHYLAGAGTGAGFVWLVLAFEASLGVSRATTVGAGGVLYLLMYGFFAGVVLPRVSFPTPRRRRVARAWGVSAAVYVVVLVALLVVAGAAA